jgi:cullin-associated NEDD8-dissociated protein 1
VENDPSLGNRFRYTDGSANAAWGLDQPEQNDYWSGKEMTWTTVALDATDQLRQKTAWALSQIFSMGANNFDYEEETEAWTTYFDIFVGHAFGNYRDILQEVSLSPLMGEYLTLAGNAAFSDSGMYPDENFAREIMQLFSIGLWELNVDGSHRSPQQSTYTNEDIMAFARVWTGWGLQDFRGNLMLGYDGFNGNIVDPMRLTPGLRDKFPKSLLGGARNLGDSYPLCSQLPARHFLQRGAKYRYHGTTSILGEPYDNAAGYAGIREHFSPDPATSAPYAELCSASSGGAQRCTFPPVVTLTSTLSCTGATECGADTLKAVKIVDGDATGFYTYVEPPCVRLQFFEGGRRGKYANWAKVCADPETVGIVGAQCCYNAETHPSGNPCPSPLFPFYESHTGNANHGDVCRAESNRWTCPIGCQQLNAAPHCVLDTDISSVCHLDRDGIASSGGGECKYVSEAMTYRTASARCAAEYPGSTICPANPGNDFSTANGASADWQTTCGGFQFSWTQEPCALQVQVLQSGEVSVVDRSTSTDHLEVDSGSNFPVVWGPSPPGATTAFPAYSSNCTAGCQVMSGGSGSCLCEANVVDTPLVFEDPSGGGQLPTITELRAALYIGAAPPESHGSAGPSGYTLCTAPLCTSRAGVQVYTRGTESAVPAALDVDTVFELVDTPATRRPSVRHPAKYLLNRVSTVHVGRDRAYRTLNPIQVASCIASTQSHPCSNAYDDHWDYWMSDAAIEPPVGAWIQLDLGTEQELRVVTVHTLQSGFAKDVRLDFSDGSTQLLTLDYTAEYVAYPLATTVTTSSIKMTVVSLIALPCVFPYVFDGVTYTECSSTSWRANDGPWCATQVDDGGIMNGWGNCAVDGINTVPGVRSSGVETGLREVMFHGPGMASFASSTPCEDVGLLPVGQTECEAAYPFFVRLQNEVAQGHDSQNSVRHVRWQPPGCSSAVGEAPDYDGDDAACFNTRPFAMYWSTEYWPVCRIPSAQSDITGFQFRNPVHFLLSAGDAVVWGDYRRANPFRNGNHLAAAAEHETEALPDHLFEHNNTAPFVASRMIQRLVTSNPSPRYIRAVATAFQEGSYGGTVYSGKYGCMASTVAAVLLDREARSSILDRDPLHGQLREPLVKVIHIMRAMEFASKRGMEVDLELMPRKIGQMAFLAPSVFGFYLPEFAPNGIVADAGLVAPEAQISTAPLTIGFLNGLSSLIDYGLTDCDNGFGGYHDKRSRCDTIRNKVAGADGDIHFAPTYPANPTKTIDELALLLTAGRLSVRTRDVIEAVYAKYLAETAFDVAAGMVQAVGALVPASECLAAVQTELGVLPITATCTASSVATWGGGQTCEHVFEQIDRSSTWKSWVSDGIEDPIGSWIRLQFAEATLVDKMVFASTWTDNYSPLQRVRLAFSDGSTQLVNLDASFDAFTYPFTSVLTSYVTITVESKHTVPCVFPFIDQGVTYSECSDIDGNGELWCATQVDENGVLEISGECAADGIHTTGGDHAAIRLLKFYTPDSAFDPYDVQQRSYLDTITSSDTPPGCSYGGWDNRAKFNLDPVGCGGLSCGRHPSVAQGEDHMWASSSTVNSPGTSTAWKAIDGSSTACFETSWQDDPWWQLDLGAVEQVTSVIVQNPRRNWAGGFNIEIDGTVCASAVITELDSTTRIPCEGTGRVVRIVLPGNNVQFGFCEVVVNLLDQPDAEGGYASNPAAESLALTHALKLLSLAPEFHTTSIATPPLNGPVDRPPPTQTESQGRPYKAIVVVFLHGGADSYGMVVPHSECGGGFDLHAEYSAIRGNSSLSKESLEATLIRTDGAGAPPQVCDVFGLHPSLPLLRQSYVDGDAAVLANTGPLVEPMSLIEYNDGTKELPPGIYAHNTMQADVYTVHSGERDAKGVLGRIVGKMGGLPVPMKTGMYTMDGYAKMLDGGYLTPEAIDPDEGLVRFRDYAELQESINELTRPESKSLFPETFADLLQHALHSTETLGAQLDNVTLTSGRTFPATSLGSQLHETSKVIQLDGENGVERSAFFTQIGGFDTHGTHDIAGHMAEIDGALGSFVQEMKDQSMWDNVTVVVASEFGRTLSTNGQGSDHGWGGNYFVLGGGVKGGQMLGSYPGRLTEFVSEANVGRGRFIPTTPWESIWNGVSEWYGIDAAGRAEILPNMANFDAGDIFTQAHLYKP